MTRLHVVDGTWELFRAHYSKAPGHTLADGRDRKATNGLVRSMLNLLHDPEEQVTHLAVAFDNPIESFRNDLFAGYKTGAGVDPALLAQFNAVEEAVCALGIVVWSMDRWECDDALATAAHRFADEVDQVRICTPDKDLGQCVVGSRVVQVDRLRKRTIDETELRVTRGFGPESIPDWLGLTGDTADGIPGLDGFGDKTAAALLARYVHLEAIPDDGDAWDAPVRGAAKLAATLRAHRADALLYRHLATLATDVPLPQDLEGLRFTGVPRGEFTAWCEANELPTLPERPQRWR